MKLDIPTVQNPQKNAMNTLLVDVDNKSEVIKKSVGDALVTTMDYMMKYEETRTRECSREHYSKKGIFFMVL